MTWRRITGLVVVAWLLFGVAAPVSGIAGDHRSIRGIVDYTDEDRITIGKNRYDIAGAPTLNPDGTPHERGSALRGKLAEIRYFKGKIVSVTVSRPMPY